MQQLEADFVLVLLFTYICLSQIEIEKEIFTGLYILFAPFGDERNTEKVSVPMVGQGQ